MKTTFLVFPLAIVSVLLTQFQASAQIAASGLTSSYSVVDRGPNDRVWARINVTTDASGNVVTNISFIRELATGMYYWQSNQWNESQELIELYPDGAIAQHGQHKVIFANNLNTTGAIDLQTPDGKELRSRILGLSYFDGVTGQSVLIAATTNSVGVLTKNNEVVYTNAFDDVAADVQYVYTRAGLEQNLVLRESLPSPAGFAMNPATTRLQVLTEFFSPPTPTIKSTMQADGGVDEYINFGVMQIGKGRAFSVGNGSDTNTLIAVRKQWTVLDNRTFLVEEVPFSQVEQQIESLGTKGGGASLDKNRRGQGVNVIAALKDVLPKGGAVRHPGPMRLAQSDNRQQPGFVLDYTLLSSQTNFCFAGNTNYFVSGLVNLSGTTKIEGGSIVKFTNSILAGAQISISGTIDCRTGQYRPAIFTSMDDDTVGETIPGSTGYPTNQLLSLYWSALVVNDTGNTLHDLRVSHAGSGVKLAFSDGQINLTNVQFVGCKYPIDASGQDTNTITIDNGLFYSNLYPVKGGEDLTVYGRQVTINQCNSVGSGKFGGYLGDLYLTNSLVVAATYGWGNFSGANGSVTTNCTAYFTTDPGGIFQTVGAASHYLADNSEYRNAGTTNIGADLLAQLKLRTTYPPIEITDNFTSDTTLTPQAQRDTDLPDLGYHYDPIDFVVSGRNVYANLTLTNGVVLGTYGPSSSYGLNVNQRLPTTGSLWSEGSATQLNWIVRYNTVQEQSVTNWSSSSVAASVRAYSPAATTPVVCRFTGWSMPGGTGDHFYGYDFGTTPFWFQNCQFGGGTFYCKRANLSVTNCLWERVGVTFDDDRRDYSCFLYNNLFYGGTLSITEQGNGPCIAKDNLFDKTSLSGSPDTHGYNGYVTNFNRFSPNQASDAVLTNSPVYLASYLGSYYYPTNDGMLSTLIDAGSRNATNAGLYHFTTTVDQVKEADSQVDIGFHYVAVDPSTGLPYDTDGDGTPDYQEDANGNGSADTGETDWQTYNSPNGLSSGSGLTVFTPLK